MPRTRIPRPKPYINPYQLQASRAAGQLLSSKAMSGSKTAKAPSTACSVTKGSHASNCKASQFFGLQAFQASARQQRSTSRVEGLTIIILVILAISIGMIIFVFNIRLVLAGNTENTDDKFICRVPDSFSGGFRMMDDCRLAAVLR